MAPYLIQRGHIVQPVVDGTHRISEAAKTDYMGSAEFEFGAMPASLRRFRHQMARCTLRTLDAIQDGQTPLRVFSYLDEDQFLEYSKHLINLRNGIPHLLRLKERSEFSLPEISSHAKHIEFVKKAQKRRRQKIEYVPSPLADFWWDIENEVMFSFNEVFMSRLPQYMQASFTYMDSKK